MAFRIVDWDDHFEVNRTRELKTMVWVPVPNNLANDGYIQLVDHPNGAAHLGAWLAILEVASRCDPRGTLVRGSRTALRSHDFASLSRLTRLPASLFAEVVPRLIEELGWMEEIELDYVFSMVNGGQTAEMSQAGAGLSHDAAEILRNRQTDRQTERSDVCLAVQPLPGGSKGGKRCSEEKTVGKGGEKTPEADPKWDDLWRAAELWEIESSRLKQWHLADMLDFVQRYGIDEVIEALKGEVRGGTDGDKLATIKRRLDARRKKSEQPDAENKPKATVIAITPPGWMPMKPEDYKGSRFDNPPPRLTAEPEPEAQQTANMVLAAIDEAADEQELKR